MLKIKDNVDLKELEKYGFAEINKEHHFYHKLIKECWCCGALFKELTYIIIDLDNNKKIKKLIVTVESALKIVLEQKLKRCSRRFIKDLIQAGLIEKV